MITAVDTNILLDVFLPDKNFVVDSSKLLKSAYDEGALIICDIVYAELFRNSMTENHLTEFFQR